MKLLMKIKKKRRAERREKREEIKILGEGFKAGGPDSRGKWQEMDALLETERSALLLVWASVLLSCLGMDGSGDEAMRHRRGQWGREWAKGIGWIMDGVIEKGGEGPKGDE